SQKISSVNITLEVKNEPLLSVLKKIEAQTSFRFVYRKGELTALPTRTVKASTYTVEEALNLLLDDTGFSFRQVGDNVLILHNNISHEFAKLSLSDELISNDISIRGQVTDSKGLTLPG